MGCPKKFSLSGGMGAALLKKPELAADIISTLRRNLNIIVSAKVRLLDTPAETVELLRRLEAAGAQALSVHARKAGEKRTSPARWDEMPSDCVSVPLIGNGNVLTHADLQPAKEGMRCDSLMIARGALRNASIFRKEGELPLDEVVSDYLRLCVRLNNHRSNSKYVVQYMLSQNKLLGQERGQLLQKTRDLRSLACLWHLGDWHDRFVGRGLHAREEDSAGEKVEEEEEEEEELHTMHHYDSAYFDRMAAEDAAAEAEMKRARTAAEASADGSADSSSEAAPPAKKPRLEEKLVEEEESKDGA
eukprot:PLAT175.2.p1 GENE.PLAT175.2~~PLAT175.2.p1  ORF type:complete len:303 (+),score=106.00 PLAT175.2:458-1366(+)